MRLKRKDIEKEQRSMEFQLDKKIIDMGLKRWMRHHYNWLEYIKRDAE